MDGVSIAASIIGIATAGVQVSIKLVTLATQISTASDHVSAVGNDISLTSNVLRQLGDLMAQETADAGISILNEEALKTTKTAADTCENIFSEVEKEVKRASKQLRRYKPGLGKMLGEKIKLSTIEKTKWPFLQPRIDGLRADLRDAKSTLVLLLQLATLALNKRMADASRSVSEHQDMIRAIVALELERPENRQPRGPKPDISVNFSLANPPGSDIPRTIKYQSDPTVGPESSRAPSQCDNKTQRTDNSELQLFHLKPLVNDFGDRIELRWVVQDANMQPRAIHHCMIKDEKDGLPSVVEMRQQLNAYEQGTVDAQTPEDSGRSILFLKRTTMDIRSRDMLFKAVPGLQFVVQCHARQSPPQNPLTETYSNQSSVTHDVRPDVSPVAGFSGGRGTYDIIIESRSKPPSKLDSALGPTSFEDEDKDKGEDSCLQCLDEDSLEAEDPCMQYLDEDSLNEEFLDEDSLNEEILDEEAEAEAEAMVNALLKQYTTLFNS